MKRLLLLTLVLVMGFTAVSQIANVPKSLLNKAKTVEYKKPIRDLSDFTVGVNPTVKSCAVAPTETILGSTYYDSWTNQSLGTKIYRYDDGTMVGIWTRGMEYSSFPDRGTAYTHFDGNAWDPAPTGRIEDIRSGWGTYAPMGLNGEIVVAHNANNLEISKRDTRYTGEWVESGYTGVAKPTWPKVVTSGEENQYQHIFYHSYDDYNGMGGAIIYTRTSDGGATWDPADVILPGMGPEDYAAFSSEEFVVASRGDIVALFVAGPWADMFLMKSIDNGETWQKTMVREHPYPFFDWASTAMDTTFVCDGSASIAIDNTGKVHVVFGLSRVMHTADQGEYYNLFPWVDGIGYWNEDMPAFSDDLSAMAGPQYEYETSEMIEDYNYIGWTQDVDENGEIEFITTEDGFPMTYSSIGLSTMPSISIDDEGRIFVVYSSYTETYSNAEYNFHKIWGRAYANGAWGPFVNLTEDIVHIFDESIHPLLTSSSDDNLHMIYNVDGFPGIAVGTTPDHDFVENFVYYSSIPKEDLLTGLNDDNLISVAGVSQNYPNPFNEITTITVELQDAANLSLQVSNILGQQVMDIQHGNVAAGTHYFRVDASKLQDGLYFYTIKANNSEVTKKMIVR